MKNELGIEICGENCTGDVIPPYDCPKCGQKKCGDENCQYFSPKTKLLEARIKELQERVEDLKLCVSMAGTYDDDYCKYLRKENEKLQEQQFTKEELQFIKDRLDECIEECDVLEMLFTAHQILKKIEANDR